MKVRVKNIKSKTLKLVSIENYQLIKRMKGRLLIKSFGF